MTAAAKPGTALALSFAFRELRGGLRGFYVFLACIALGVATIAGVGSVTRLMADSIAREGKAILGGDISFTLVGRPASDVEKAFLAGQGDVSEVATLRGMARTLDGTDGTLVEIKAVDPAYPLYGEMTVKEGGAPSALLGRTKDGFGAIVDDTLLIRLGLKIGDEIKLGGATMTLAGTVDSEPDRLSAGADFGPRLMLSKDALSATGLVQPGSIVYWLYRVRLAPDASDAAVAAVGDQATLKLPDAGWRIRTRDDASPGLKHNIDRLAEFLTLVGLSALIVGGVGVANAVGAYLATKRDVIATFKCLGAPGGFIVRLYLVQILALAVLGILIGSAIGALIPFVASFAFKSVIPIPAQPSIYPTELLLAAADGLATALAFALWPLGRVRDVPPTALFRDMSGGRRTPTRLVYAIAAGLSAAVLAGLAIGFAKDRQIALIYAGAAVGSFVLLRLVGLLIMLLAKRAPRFRFTPLRLALANIHRPGALTPAVVLSLGLGLTLLTTLMLIDGNLRRELTASIPAQAPSFYFLDVQADRLAPFMDFLRQAAPEAKLDEVALLRGRIVSIGGTPADEVVARPDSKWVLEGDRGITFADQLPENSKLVAGQWWPQDYAGPPLVSFERDAAIGLGVSIGDMIKVNVLGRVIEAKVASVREVDWQSLGLNFLLVYSPNTFLGAPHSHLVTLSLPPGRPAASDVDLLKKVGAAYPAVTSLRVKDAIDRVNDLLRQIAWAILAASSIALITAALVLAGALAAGHHRRLYDAVILKTLGATRRQLMLAFGLEYLILGLATAIFALIAGSLASSYVLTQTMQSHFTLLPGVALGTVAFAITVTLTLGLVGTWRILGEKAAPVLRNL